jgi:hypothetical protein
MVAVMRAVTALMALVFRWGFAGSPPIYVLLAGAILNAVVGTIIASETYNLAGHFVPAIAPKPPALKAFDAKTLILVSNAFP